MSKNMNIEGVDTTEVKLYRSRAKQQQFYQGLADAFDNLWDATDVYPSSDRNKNYWARLTEGDRQLRAELLRNIADAIEHGSTSQGDPLWHAMPQRLKSALLTANAT